VNYFQLVLKQMRQRALSTWLTTLSVMLGVGLAIAILVMGREAESLFGQSDYGYDAIIGKKGSQLQLVLNTVYHMDVSPGNIPFTIYGRLLKGGDLYPFVHAAVPTVVGDTYQGQYRIIGTLPKLFGYDDLGNPLPEDQIMNYRPGRHMTIDQGHVFATNKFEAVIGSDIPLLTGLKLGDQFQAMHGTPTPGQAPEMHAQKWTVVGILAPTHTANDRCLYISLLSFYTIPQHGLGLLQQQQLRDGSTSLGNQIASAADETAPPPDASGIQHFKYYDFNTHDQTLKLTIPPDAWAVSAILVQSRGGVTEQRLAYDLNNGTDVMACNPAEVMRGFFNVFLKPSRQMLLIICSLVTFVAAVGILVSIYNSVSARLKEIAILRALGATRQTILTLICLEAGLIALIGSILGLVAGHAVSAIGSLYMQDAFGESFNWIQVSSLEIFYVAGVVILAAIAGLVPAIKAYRTPVATNLVAA
jgi:putative ABC transport system permease protein